jgi:hypothetical protein
MNNDAMVERMANAMLGEPVTPKGDTLTATDIRYSMSPVYRIKPLVWRQEEYFWYGEVGNSASLHAFIEQRSGWNYEIRADSDGDFVAIKHGWDYPTLDAAKLAAESAYRKLIAEHLEQVT